MIKTFMATKKNDKVTLQSEKFQRGVERHHKRSDLEVGAEILELWRCNDSLNVENKMRRVKKRETNLRGMEAVFAPFIFSCRM